MVGTLVLGLAAFLQDGEAGLGADQFARVMEGLHSEVRDVSFIFEGDDVAVDPKRPADNTGEHFQGSYTFRTDGATLLDVYKRNLGANSVLSHDTDAAIKGRLTRIHQIPDRRRTSKEVTEDNPEAFAHNASPERILYVKYFNTLKDPAAFGYEHENWEDVDGHRCLRLKVNAVPNSVLALAKGDKSKLPYYRFWIDLKRGGHPLKVEFFLGENLWLRTLVQLDRVPLAKGKSIWFPVKGQTETFFDGSWSPNQPLRRENYFIIRSSLQFNQNLSDKLFSAKEDDGSPVHPQLAKAHQEFADAPRPPLMRTDPASVKTRLDQQLTEADRQSKQLEALSPERTGLSSYLPYGFAVLGVLILCGLGVWRWRKG